MVLLVLSPFVMTPEAYDFNCLFILVDFIHQPVLVVYSTGILTFQVANERLYCRWLLIRIFPYRRRYRSERELKECIKEFIIFYNERRPHEKLNYKTPNEVETAYVQSLMTEPDGSAS